MIVWPKDADFTTLFALISNEKNALVCWRDIYEQRCQQGKIHAMDNLFERTMLVFRAEVKTLCDVGEVTRFTRGQGDYSYSFVNHRRERKIGLYRAGISNRSGDSGLAR